VRPRLTLPASPSAAIRRIVHAVMRHACHDRHRPLHHCHATRRTWNAPSPGSAPAGRAPTDGQARSADNRITQCACTACRQPDVEPGRTRPRTYLVRISLSLLVWRKR
jgi:hypothetical protein